MDFRRVSGILILAICTAQFSTVMADEKEDSTDKLWRAAQKAASQGNSTLAVQLASQVIAAKSERPAVFRLRGREYFRLGKIKESIDDLDRVAALSPSLEKQLWDRGISYYYAEQYKKGAQQFELYQTYHDNDVENSVWRYLCMARSVGVEKARKVMLPIRNDTRIPMMEIYNLYRGLLKPEEVLKAAKSGKPSAQALNRQLFYAHLYLGLYYEAAKDNQLAKQHLLEAEKHKISHYMWDVAHVHVERLRKQKNKDAKKLIP